MLRDGAMCLTLDAVAAESGMSKGGLLYHFRSKDDLVRGMIRRMQDEYEADVERLAATDRNPRGRRLRAMLRASFPARKIRKRERMEQLAAALLAAVATNPKLLDEMRQRVKLFEQRVLKEGLDPVTAMVIHCAADGLWLSGLFGFHHRGGAQRRRVVARLLKMTEAK